MKMEETSSSSPVKEGELSPTQQTLPAATPDATVSGNAESPPLGSNLSSATPNETVSGNAESPPLGSDLSSATPNETVSGNAESPPLGSDLYSGTARSPPLDHSLVPAPKSQKLEAGSSAGSSVKMGASSLSSSSIPAKDSSQERQLSPTQQTLPEATATSSPLGTDPSLAQPNVTVSGTAAFPPPGSGVSGAPSQDSFQPLNLRLTKTPEFLKKIESLIKQSRPDFTDKTLEKPKAMNFPISKITIGQWTRVMVYPADLRAKIYFGMKQLIWEILDDVETGTPVSRLKKKIEIQWADVLSFRAAFHPHDETGTLEVELGKRPTFFAETNPRVGKSTQWKQMDQDFTLDQSASRCRRHTLHFSPGVLQTNLEKLVSGDSFWSTLAKVTFPTLPHSLYFDSAYGSDTGEFLGTQTNLMTGYNNNSNSQGPGRVEVGDSIKTHTRDDDVGHMGAIAEDNSSDEVLGTQQLNEPSDLPVNQGREQVRITGKFDVASTNEQTLNNDDDSTREERES